MAALMKRFPIDVICFASPHYWRDHDVLDQAYRQIQTALRNSISPNSDVLRFVLATSESALSQVAEMRPSLALFVPMSGGVQPWMQTAACATAHIGLLHAYIPGLLSVDNAFELLNRNAHPAATDVYAWCRRHNRSIMWIRNPRELASLVQGFQAARRLQNATILKIGETEPWVINSCRDPERFRSSLGTKIIPLSLETLYAQIEKVSDNDVALHAENWIRRATALHEVNAAAVNRACRVTAGMNALIREHDADGISIACFAMIGAQDTTSCLAVSDLNSTCGQFAACEGDLDAAATMLLLKAVGGDFVWVANPIIYGGDFIDLVHCTAPRCACGQNLAYRLLHHHESGRGVAPEVCLPEYQDVTLSRIGLDLTTLSISRGHSERVPKMPACHTQLRVHLNDPVGFLDRLLGTHVVLSYGNQTACLKHAARFLNLDVREDGPTPAAKPAAC